MAKFAITWSLGRVEHVIQEAASSVEEFVNIHFGSMWREAQDTGVKVELVAEEAQHVTEQTQQSVAEAEAAAKAEADKVAAEAETAAKDEAAKLAATLAPAGATTPSAQPAAPEAPAAPAASADLGQPATPEAPAAGTAAAAPTV